MKKTTNLAKFMPKDSVGFEVRDNPKNGFTIIGIHYTADPKKRNPDWIAQEKLGLTPKQWAVEMERSWETYAGKPVYEGAFYKHLHVLKQTVGPRPHFPIFRGWDFGGNQSVAICQIIGQKVYVLDELPNMGTNTLKFAPEVVSFCNTQYGTDYTYIDIIDPSAMWEGKTSAGKACADVMRDLGLKPKPAPTNDPQKRVLGVIELLSSISEGSPNLLINPHCQTLISGFEAAYHYPEKPNQSQRADRPVKNLYSHVHDALQYVALIARSYQKAVISEEDAYERSLTQIPKYRFAK